MKASQLSHTMTLSAVLLGMAWLLGSVVEDAQAVTIDFDNLSFLDIVTTQYPEVTFSADPGFETQVGTPSSSFGTSPPNFSCSAALGGGFPKCENETILTFTNPVNNLTFKSVGIDNAGVVARVDIFTPNLVITQDITKTPQLIDLSAYSDVSKVRLYDINDNNGIGWDDFTFDVVPEPASASLLAAGVIGRITQRKRRAS
jgi:hypothetical protein